MSPSIDLRPLGAKLQQEYAAADARMLVRISNRGEQITVVPAANSDRAGSLPRLKRSTRALPHGATFELYISIESQEVTASTQRVAPGEESSATLVLNEGTRERIWNIAAPSGERVVIRLRLGEAMSIQEANRMLTTVRRMIW